MCSEKGEGMRDGSGAQCAGPGKPPGERIVGSTRAVRQRQSSSSSTARVASEVSLGARPISVTGMGSP